MEEILTELNKEVQAGEAEKVKQLIRKALDKGISAIDVLEKGLRAAMEEVGQKFEALEIFLPEMMSAADAMKEGVELLQPHLASGSDGGQRGSILLGTVEGDIHDIGKNIVKIMLEGVGFKVTDLGFNVPTLSFVERVKEIKPDVVGMSALMTSTMVHMPRLVQFLEDRGLREGVKVMVGGAPVLPDWAEKIGADGYGDNAAEAIKVAKEMIK
ncbi:MAG: corrinoid protein [Spirochaetales bacterium]|nr:corrinoid protein [Spirochaetales bacterium]